MSKMIIGTGPGQCGFQAMVDVLNLQRDCRVQCQSRPLLSWALDQSTDFRVRFQSIEADCQSQICGDFGSYYLPYLRKILADFPSVLVLCLKRPVQELVGKFKTELRERYPCRVNYWSAPNEVWTNDPVWGRCYPQFDNLDLETSIQRYCEEYYAEVDRIKESYPGRVLVIDPASTLSTYAGLRELFDFLEIPEAFRNYATGRWNEKSVDPHIQLAESRAPNYSDDPLDPRRCVVLTPYHSQIHPQCDRNLDELQAAGYVVRKYQGCTSIDFIRSQIVTDALVDGFEETMWIDADVGFDAADVLKLRQHNLDVVSGIYAQKGKQAMASHLLPGMKSITFGNDGGLNEMLYAATGFLLLKRNAYLHVQRGSQLPVCNERSGRPLIPFFEPLNHEIDDGYWYLAEDYAFSERLRRSKYQIWADTSIRLWHYGMYGYGWEDTVKKIDRYDRYKVNFGSP